MMIEKSPCGLDVSLAVMGGKWKPLILFHLASGPKRFGELKRTVVGISEKVLIQQLRELAAAGVLTRHDYQRIPPMVDYTMTAFGMTLARALMPLCVWGTENRAHVTTLTLSCLSDRIKSAASFSEMQPATAI
jgi:DNA-binding HxlR family transcriptional regulator